MLKQFQMERRREKGRVLNGSDSFAPQPQGNPKKEQGSEKDGTQRERWNNSWQGNSVAFDIVAMLTPYNTGEGYLP